MKTIEDKLQAAYELGRIVVAAECFADEDVRNTVCGAAHALFDGLLTEAGEEAKASREMTAGLIRLAQNYPPDPFDLVEPGELVEKEPEPKKQTNFDRITKSPEVLAEFLGEELSRCPDEMAGKQCNELCIFCWLDQLNKEVEDE
jgi:hypothetical protein